ncbi:MAG: hypothetical protein Q4C89_04760 [Deinococcus sp.]|uniref:hypothetical protein n=1 Tax=Deinococcus sp. TaxID=47478 RepID=UPI0026DB4063|nr:hypothetical protein [Deinococcus sp.]MDO4245311.1 hypothetical protein [Deinococcus sp.]
MALGFRGRQVSQASNNGHIQLNQTEVPLVAGQKCTLTFTGRASSPRSVAVVVGENAGSFARSLDAKADLMPTGKEFSYTFTARVTNPSAQLQISGAVGEPGESYSLSFRDFHLVPVN